MSVKQNHSSECSMYFCTFTCYNWLPLFEKTKGYDLVYNWFQVLKTKNTDIIAYVIMPNHVHCIINCKSTMFNLNKILANGKRFMAYEIIKRLEEKNDSETLSFLKYAVSDREKKKGQLHKVFKDSFDAKAIFSDKFLEQKLNYIHLNPVNGKWNLVMNYTDYEHSSASFYENGEVKHFAPVHYLDL